MVDSGWKIVDSYLLSPINFGTQRNNLDGDETTDNTSQDEPPRVENLMISSTYYFPTPEGIFSKVTAYNSDGSPSKTDTFITRTLTASANGITVAKIFTTRFIYYPPAPTDPSITEVINSNCPNGDCSSLPILKLETGNREQVGRFKIPINSGDEPIRWKVGYYQYESDVDKDIMNNLIRIEGQDSEWYKLSIDPYFQNGDKIYAIPVGNHTVTLTNMTFWGRTSGTIRNVVGFPLTFSFEVK